MNTIPRPAHRIRMAASANTIAMTIEAVRRPSRTEAKPPARWRSRPGAAGLTNDGRLMAVRATLSRLRATEAPRVSEVPDGSPRGVRLLIANGARWRLRSAAVRVGVVDIGTNSTRLL